MRAYGNGRDAELLREGQYEVHGRVVIDALPIEELFGYDPLAEATWGADLDQPVQSAKISFDLGLGSKSTSPLIAASPSWGGRKLFDVGREVLLQTAITEPGVGRDGAVWKNMFHGRIDRYNPASGDDLLSIECRDIFSDLLEFLEYGFKGGGVVVDLAMYAILDEMLGPGGAASIPWAVLGSPTLAIPEYWQEEMPALEAMRILGLQNGWDLRGRWGTGGFGDNEYVLTYYDVERDRTAPHYEMGPEEYDDVQDFTVSRDEIRNAIDVRIPGTRVKFMAEDAASQFLYRRKYMRISEPRSAHVNTSGEAQALANYALSDLKDPKATQSIIRPYFWPVELNDVHLYRANGVHYSSDQTLAVSGYQHTLTGDGDGVTVLRTRGRPAAANREWRLNFQKRWFVETTDPVEDAPEGSVWYKTASIAFPP